MFDPELTIMKRIDLRSYAASLGYAKDTRESSRCSEVMRHPDGDKMIITLKPDGVYRFWSVRNDHRGTILDFIKYRKGLNLGEIRKELRAWTGTAALPLPALPALSTTSKDRQAVQDRFAAMRVAHRHPYLEDERGIPALALQYWRFDGRIKIDQRHSNAAFAHYDCEGLCGYELRNRNFKGFASSGTKGLFLSKTIPEDNRLVICESAIDAISYAVLYPDGRTRYASIGGKPSFAQVELLKAEMKRMPEASEIVAAMDNDHAGIELAAVVSKAFDEVRRHTQVFRNHFPVGVKDWNEALLLQSTKRQSVVSSSPLEAQPAYPRPS